MPDVLRDSAMARFRYDFLQIYRCVSKRKNFDGRSAFGNLRDVGEFLTLSSQSSDFFCATVYYSNSLSYFNHLSLIHRFQRSTAGNCFKLLEVHVRQASLGSKQEVYDMLPLGIIIK